MSAELDLFKKDSETTIQNIVLRSVVQGVPFIGSSRVEPFLHLVEHVIQALLRSTQRQAIEDLHDLQ